MSKDKISVIVPCYNEEESVDMFYKTVTDVLKTIPDTEYEIIFVDDGSGDHTLVKIRDLHEKDPHCRYVSFSRNFGKEAAMYAGLSEAQGDYCVFMDADLQHPPGLLPKMYEALTKEGYDCCGGKRIGREGDGAVRSFLSSCFYKVCRMMTHMDMTDGYGDYRMMNRKMRDAILEMKEYNRYMKGIFAFVGFQTKWIPFENTERAAGVSKWNFKSLFAYAAEGILSFSSAPLKLAGAFGVIMNIIGMILTVMTLFLQLPEITWILAVICILSGIQMIFLYIIGLYLSKDCMENKRRPVYIVRERGI